MRIRPRLLAPFTRTGLLLVAASLAPAFLASAASAAERYTVIVNTDSKLKNISRDELSRIYLGKLTLWESSGTRVAPAMADESSPLGQAFLEDVTKKNVDQYRNYWKRQLFSGGGTPPKVYKKASEVVDYVARNPGGIGIVEIGTADSRVRAIEVTN
jgi:ABC-type phosphate transport system substrate-binding protein